LQAASTTGHVPPGNGTTRPLSDCSSSHITRLARRRLALYPNSWILISVVHLATQIIGVRACSKIVACRNLSKGRRARIPISGRQSRKVRDEEAKTGKQEKTIRGGKPAVCYCHSSLQEFLCGAKPQLHLIFWLGGFAPHRNSCTHCCSHRLSFGTTMEIWPTASRDE
jgi:hypothetical protein